jgi:type II secretory pathway component GspD/PulD (secretin)
VEPAAAVDTEHLARVTFTAADAPLRDVLALLAEAGGVTLVIDPAVTGRVSFHFQDTPALEALEALARQAGYQLSPVPAGPVLPFMPRTVFYHAPVNINTANAATIRARFGVGRELAEWIVLSRPNGAR